MRRDTDVALRYLTEDPVPISDIIESLEGMQGVFIELAAILPAIVPGVSVERVEIKVREISQQSPLREIFLIALFLAYQKDLEHEVVANIEALTGVHVPENWDTMVTVLAMVIIFYGVGAIKDLVTGGGSDGAAKHMLDNLIDELAIVTATPKSDIKKSLEDRYQDKKLLKRVSNIAARFFLPSKHQSSAPIEFNARQIARHVVEDVPAPYMLDHESEKNPSRSFSDVTLELHAQDRDHGGRGWAAVPRGISERRLPLRLMGDVATSDLWGHDAVRGDIQLMYERIGSQLVPKQIHLLRVSGFLR